MRKLPSINDSLEESSQKSINEYKGHKCVGYNIDCNFFSKEKYIITGREDSHIYFYDTNSGKIAQKLLLEVLNKDTLINIIKLQFLIMKKMMKMILINLQKLKIPNNYVLKWLKKLWLNVEI